MGSGVAWQCSENRCLARWTVWIPHRGHRGRGGRANSKKDLVTDRSEVFVPYRQGELANRQARRAAPAVAITCESCGKVFLRRAPHQAACSDRCP
jgi:hypothetical protein